jgi:hypothetical protein
MGVFEIAQTFETTGFLFKHNKSRHLDVVH